MKTKGDLIDRALWVLLANTLESHGMTTEGMINVTQGYMDTEIYEICKEYIREEMLETAQLLASQLTGETIDRLELEISKRGKKLTGCMFGDILN